MCPNRLDQVMTYDGTIKCFLRKIGEKYSLKKKSNNQLKSPKSPEPIVNEVMESVTTNKNYPAIQKPISNTIDKDDLMKLFIQLSGLMSSMLD